MGDCGHPECAEVRSLLGDGRIEKVIAVAADYRFPDSIHLGVSAGGPEAYISLGFIRGALLAGGVHGFRSAIDVILEFEKEASNADSDSRGNDCETGGGS